MRSNMAKSMADVRTVVLAYGPDQRNKWLKDPKGKENVLIDPALASMPPSDFVALFSDFTQYIREDNGMPDVIPTSTGMKECPDWGSLVGYIFNLQ